MCSTPRGRVVVGEPIVGNFCHSNPSLNLVTIEVPAQTSGNEMALMNELSGSDPRHHGSPMWQPG